MGGGFYNQNTRSVRTEIYLSSTPDQIFEQNKKQQMHESMDPKKALLREARDSADHPASFPIILALDVTGSMQGVPVDIIRNGLPSIMEHLTSGGCPDATLLFIGIGDHETDTAPLQIGQFESSDDKLDMWLTRVWIEKGGGGNGGESYPLVWYYAANHTSTDSLEKRSQKGVLITVGDEPFLPHLRKDEIEKIFGTSSEVSWSAQELYKKAAESWDIYHIHVQHHRKGSGYNLNDRWTKLLNEKVYTVFGVHDVSKAIVDIALRVHKSYQSFPSERIEVLPVPETDKDNTESAGMPNPKI